ncbi:MAG: HD family phosphohydrolase [Bacillota bacterium]|jgi:putative nucleotidyltransferase with HDIG domain
MNKNKEQEKKFRLPRVLAAFWWIIVGAAAFFIISIGIGSDSVDLKVGQYSPNNVYYFGTSVTYVSQQQTAAAKQLAADEVGDVYKIDDMVILNVHKEVDALFDKIYGIRTNGSLSSEVKYAQIAAVFGGNVSSSAIDYYMNLSDLDISKLVTYLKDVITAGYTRDIKEDEIDTMVDGLKETVDQSNYIPEAREFMKDIIGVLEFPANKIVDQQATDTAVEEAMENIQPIQVTVNPGQLIVRRGEEVTETTLETLKALGLVSQSSQYLKYFGVLFLVVLCLLVIRAYCGTLDFPNDKKERSVVVLTLLLLIILLLGRLITLISVNTNLTTDLMLGLLIPVPAFSLLAASLVNKRASILGTVVLSIFIGIMCSGHMLYVMAALLGGLVGVIETGKMDNRNKYLVIMLYISGTYCLTLLAWSFIWGYSLSYISFGLIMGAVNGILSVILAIGALPMLESMFGITTRIHLLELSNTNHPLLKKLMIEAPGTYNHSVLVGNLAEAAADEIGANGLLVRVASYFHDIGKVKRPYLFIENQNGGDNPHDKLQPSLSTFIITSHTKGGAELARRYKLPKEIIDIILQHHGTSLVAGFYRKAQTLAVAKGGKAEDVRAEDFRYPGPVPQTKEAALVMLADSCQAAVLAMNNPTRGQIEGRVREVIKGKFDDGQLAECDLTFRNLDLIASAFVRVLAGVNHKRIPYPDQLEKELRSRRQEEKRQQNVKQKLNARRIMEETRPGGKFVETDAAALEKEVDKILAEKNLKPPKIISNPKPAADSGTEAGRAADKAEAQEKK